ncbi:hypothetical protein J132_09358 [Termitomyces sp. J132]|nr:hypothetical protein J132_09358 [Termitomyces sp. J132]
MASLSSVPCNVLQHIAFNLAIFSLPQPPLHLSSLLLACSNIHQALRLQNCPQLYARIFRATFDLNPDLHTRISDSILASELYRRHRVLWRTRCMDLSSDLDQEELCSAIRMVIEDTGQNEKLLSSAGFSTFLMSSVLQRLMHVGAVNLLPLSDDNPTSMVMWLLCLTLNHQDINNTPEEKRNALLRLLRFPTAYRVRSDTYLSQLLTLGTLVSGEPVPTNPLTPPMLGKFSCLKPMQCAITEYLCFSPYLPIPSSYSLDLLELTKGLIGLQVKSGGFGYGKYAAAADEGISAGRLSSEVIDVIFLGETLPDHEQAFGGFKFSGRIRADGYMIMCREPKNYADREGLGTWIFEGHLRYGVALVGQWRTSISTATYDLRGIFSLHKTSDVR